MLIDINHNSFFKRNKSKDKTPVLKKEKIKSGRPPRHPLHEQRPHYYRSTIGQRSNLSDSLRPLNTPNCSQLDVTLTKRKCHSTAVPKYRKRSKSECRTKPNISSTPIWMERNTSEQWKAHLSSCESLSIDTDIQNKDAWEQLRIFQERYLEGERNLQHAKVVDTEQEWNGDENEFTPNQSMYAQMGQKRNEMGKFHQSIPTLFPEKAYSPMKSSRIPEKVSSHTKSYDEVCSNETVKVTEDDEYNEKVCNSQKVFNDYNLNYNDDCALAYNKVEEEEIMSIPNQKRSKQHQKSESGARKSNNIPHLVFPDPPDASKTPTSITNSGSSSFSEGNKPKFNAHPFNNNSNNNRISISDQNNPYIIGNTENRGRSRSNAARNKRYYSNNRISQLSQKRRMKGDSFAGGASSHDSMPILQDSMAIVQKIHNQSLRQQNHFHNAISNKTEAVNNVNERKHDTSNIYHRSHSQPPRYVLQRKITIF